MKSGRNGPKDLQDPKRAKRLLASRMWAARYRHQFSDTRLVAEGAAELKTWRVNGRIPLAVFLDILEIAADEAREA